MKPPAPLQAPAPTFRNSRRNRARTAAFVIGLFAISGPSANAYTVFELDLVATEEQLRAGGLQEFPVILREMTFGPPDHHTFFGIYPMKNLGSIIEDPSRNSTPLDFIPASGLTAEVLQLNPNDASGIQITLTADPSLPINGTQSAIAGFKEFQIGKVRVQLGPRIVLDDGIGGVPDGVRLLEIDFSFGGGTVQPLADSPESGRSFTLTSNQKRYESDDFEPDTEDVTEADGDDLLIDEPITNLGVLRATNGGELRIGAEIVNFGIIEALAGSTVTNLGFGMRQFEGADTSATFDDTQSGGTFRAIDGILNVAPPGFILSEIEAGSLELSGPLAQTNLFDEASGGPGRFVTGGRSLTLSDGGFLRLDNGVGFDVFQISLFDGRLEIMGGSEVTTFVGLSGSSGTVAGDGSITADFVGLNVGRVEPGRDAANTGTLSVEGDCSFQVQSELVIDIAGDEAFDRLDVSGRLFIQTGELDGARLLLHVGDGYTPALGTLFEIASAGEIDGNFDLVCDDSPWVDFVPSVAGGTLVLETVADPLGDFRRSYGLAEDGSDDLGDASSNGIPNLFYYTYGIGDPTSAAIDRERLPRFSKGEEPGTVVFSYVRPVRAGCLRFLTLTSSNLENWVRPGSLGLGFLPISETVDDIDATHRHVRQTFAIREGDPIRFYSLDVGMWSAE